MEIVNFDSLRLTLSKNKVQVTFTKLNGEERVMTCTTNSDLIPPSAWPQSKTLEEESVNHKRQIRVYDVNAQGWRSFIFDRVKNVKVVE